MVRTGKLPETFVSHKEKIFNSNKFALVTLPNLDNYDVELSITLIKQKHAVHLCGLASDVSGEFSYIFTHAEFSRDIDGF